MEEFFNAAKEEGIKKLIILISMLVLAALFFGCPVDVPVPIDNGNDDPPPVTYSAPVIRGRVAVDESRSASRQNAPDQVWVVPVYHRIGGFETGISWLSLQYAKKIDLADDGSFAFAYADQDAPEGIAVIDEFVAEYSHGTDENPNDRSVFSGSVLMILVNSAKAESENLEDRKEALIGYIAIPTASEAATLISLPIAEIKEDEEEAIEIDLGEIEEPEDDTREARSEATVQEVQEYLKLELATLMALASTDGVLKTIGNFVVNNTLVIAGLDPEDLGYFHMGAGLGHTGLYKGALTSNVGSGDRTEESPEIHSAINVWDPRDESSFGEDAMKYMGYQVYISGSDNLGELTITPPEGVTLPQGEERYIAPDGFNVHGGWWNVTSGSGDRAAAFQMDAAQVFNNNGTLRVLVPKIEFGVEEAPASFKLWRPMCLLHSTSQEVIALNLDIGDEVGVDQFSVIADLNGSNHFLLQQLNDLTISWYFYDHEEGEYVKADDEFVKLALGYVGVSIAGPHGGGVFFEGNNTHTIRLHDTGNTQWLYLEENEDSLATAVGYDVWREDIAWKEFRAIDDLNNEGAFVWDLASDSFSLFFDPTFHDHDNPDETIYQVTNRESQGYGVVTGEGVDRVFWKGLPAEWTPIRAIHVHYFMHGIGMRFSFGADM